MIGNDFPPSAHPFKPTSSAFAQLLSVSDGSLRDKSPHRRPEGGGQCGRGCRPSPGMWEGRVWGEGGSPHPSQCRRGVFGGRHSTLLRKFEVRFGLVPVFVVVPSVSNCHHEDNLDLTSRNRGPESRTPIRKSPSHDPQLLVITFYFP